MNRRKFLQSIVLSSTAATLLSKVSRADSWYDEDVTAADFVIMYDTHAQALYMDGGLGPTTGIIKVDYILKNEDVTLTFWHGHGGVDHEFTVTREHFNDLKKMKRVYIVTTEVENHTHRLFIEPKDPKWRVEGAQPVKVPLNTWPI